MNKPKLTIIIPAYNEINTIQNLIDKVSNLKIDKQIILIDDNSEDGTSDIIKIWAKVLQLKVNKNLLKVNT